MISFKQLNSAADNAEQLAQAVAQNLRDTLAKQDRAICCKIAPKTQNLSP